MAKLIIYLFICSLIASCSQETNHGFVESPTGVEYLFHTTTQGTKPKRGEVVMLDITLQNQAGFPIETDMYHSSMFGHPIDGKTTLGHHIDNILLKSHINDSLTMRLKASYLFGKTFLPQSVSVEDIITCQIKIKDVISFSDYQEQQSKLHAVQAIERIAENNQAILTYLQTNNLKATKLPEGVYCLVKNKGKGLKPQAEDLVKLHYTVYQLDGTRVDASYDRNEPFQFVVGRGEVIEGLDKAIRTVEEGTEATILIPSEMAYGEESKGKLLPPHTNLRFEVKLIEIER